MAIVWALRSDNANFSARYSLGSLVGRPAAASSANLPTYGADATALGGNSFDLSLAGAATRCLVYSGRDIFSSVAFSVLMRVKFTTIGTYGLMEITGSPFAGTPNNFNLYMVSDWRCGFYNQTPAACISPSVIYATPPSTGTWYDVVFTWDGTTSANAAKLWIDGSNVGSLTASAAATDPRDSAYTNQIVIGGIIGASSTRYLINEVVIWDAVINPASVELVGGTGSLNGASRTAFVDVASFDGSASTGGGFPTYSI